MPDHAIETLKRYLERQGYYKVRRLPDGRWLGVQKMLYTAGLFIMTVEAPITRFCYEHPAEAEQAFDEWDGNGDPPGAWIKQKPEDRHGPGSKVPLEHR
jgi:hypothetical protein